MQLAPPEPQQPAELLERHQLRRGIQDHRTERGLGKVPHDRPGDEEHEDDDGRSDQRVHLAASPGRHGQSGPRPRRRHGEPADEPDEDVRAAEGHELALRVDLAIGGPLVGERGRREGAREEHVVAVGHERDAEARNQQDLELGPGHVGHVGQRYAARHIPDHGHAVAAQPQNGIRDRRSRHGDERGGPSWPEPVQDEDERERAQPDRQRRQVGAADDLGERTHLLDDALPVDGRAGHLAELADDHEDGRPGEVADEERLGEQVGDDPEPEHPRDERPPGDDEAERRRPAR